MAGTRDAPEVERCPERAGDVLPAALVPPAGPRIASRPRLDGRRAQP